jgi:hypothetical protein
MSEWMSANPYLTIILAWLFVVMVIGSVRAWRGCDD